MQVSVLIDNLAKPNMCCEHGLSLLIRFQHWHILLDAGSSGQFAENADRMGISLENVDFAVLSHGHYDHAGGLATFFARNEHAPVFARSTIAEPYFSAKGGLHEIGVPETVMVHRDRFTFIDETTELADHIWLVGHRQPYSAIGETAGLFRKDGDSLLPDDFRHEQSLVIELPQGLVIFNSCSHAGVENIITEVKETLGDKSIYAYIGGMHMKGTSSDGQEICTFSDVALKRLCSRLHEEQIQWVYTGHCTGLPAISKLRSFLGSRLRPLSAGQSFPL